MRCIHREKHGNKLIGGMDWVCTAFDRKYEEGGSITWAYAALYCCIWLAPGIIADPVASLMCFVPPEDEGDSRENLKKLNNLQKRKQMS